MNKVLIRVLLFVIGLPAVLGLALWNWQVYLPLALVATVVSAFGADETAALFRQKGVALNRVLPFLLGALLPFLAYLENRHLLSAEESFGITTAVLIIVLIRQVFTNSEERLEAALPKVGGMVFTLFYPGLFLYFFLKIPSLPDSAFLTPIFLAATFGNDAWAWLFGTLWGRWSKRPFRVSPSKSNIGFLGGGLATLLIFGASFFLFPGALGHQLWLVLLVAVLFALSTILGDLFESSLKRSAKVKDSGNLIPGRGGILDSIDSLLFSAPLFYFFLQYGRF